MQWRDLDDCVRRHLAGAKHGVVIVAPFIKREALAGLLSSAPRSVALTVHTRWRIDEVAAGVSDPQILEDVEARGGSVWLCDELHAKLFLVDGARALVGSSNVTAAALGLSARPNLEILQSVDLEDTEASMFLATLRARSRKATPQEAAGILEAAAQLRIFERGRPAAPDAQPAAPQAATPWLPRFRSPDRLYRLARDASWLGKAGPEDPALLDLVASGADPRHGEAAFEAQVRSALLASPVVVSLDVLLLEPQRFGALTDWLRGLIPDADHEGRQSAGQTLIRWLTYFAPDRYEVGTPGAYSEVLSLRRSALGR